MTADATDTTEDRSTLWHATLLYEGAADYVEGVVSFLNGGLAADEPMLVAVPGPHVDLIRAALGGSADRITFEDMTQLGRNPGRIIPAIRRFVDAHVGRRVWFVGEPIWPGRSDAEVAEATKHEALINLAFADSTACVLCPYDVRGLELTVIADSHCTHPDVISHGAERPSTQYTDPAMLCDAAAWRLPAAPADAQTIEVGVGRLAVVRRFVGDHASAWGLADHRVDDLVAAVNEVATNTLVHGPGVGQLRVWREPTSVVCEVCEQGRIVDPLAGRRLPSVGMRGGRGLLVANHLCDLVEMRTDDGHLTIRLRVTV